MRSGIRQGSRSCLRSPVASIAWRISPTPSVHPNPPPPKRLRLGSYLALELNTATAVPEWGGRQVTMMAEDPVYLTADGWKFFRPRQEALYLVK